MPPRLGAAEKRFSGLDFWTEMPKFHLSYTLSINVLGRPPCADAAATLCVASLLWRATSSQARLLVAEMQPLALPKGQGWAETQEPGPLQPGRGCRPSWVAQQGWQGAWQSHKRMCCLLVPHTQTWREATGESFNAGTDNRTSGLGKVPHHFGATVSIEPIQHTLPRGDGCAHASLLSSPALWQGRSHWRAGLWEPQLPSRLLCPARHQLWPWHSTGSPPGREVT